MKSETNRQQKTSDEAMSVGSFARSGGLTTVITRPGLCSDCAERLACVLSNSSRAMWQCEEYSAELN